MRQSTWHVIRAPARFVWLRKMTLAMKTVITLHYIMVVEYLIPYFFVFSSFLLYFLVCQHFAMPFVLTFVHRRRTFFLRRSIVWLQNGPNRALKFHVFEHPVYPSKYKILVFVHRSVQHRLVDYSLKFQSYFMIVLHWWRHSYKFGLRYSFRIYSLAYFCYRLPYVGTDRVDTVLLFVHWLL